MVGYRTFGHMFFLEDGGEHNNTIDRVLGINAYAVPDEDILLLTSSFIIDIIIQIRL